METSLLKTLANKNRTTVAQTVKRLESTSQTPEGPRQSLKLIIPREGKQPLVATFGGISLTRKDTAIQDQVIMPHIRKRSEIVEKLLNDTWEVCGAKEHVEMHHIRKLADLHKKGRKAKPQWMELMISRKRKSIPLCKTCHMNVHHNRPKSKEQGNWRAG